MATFFEGSRGSGKSKYAVQEIQNHLRSGRAVATNLDLFLDELMPGNHKASYTRLPDYPRSSDLIGLGKAYASLDHDDSSTYDAKQFGVVVLDELLTSFNSRNWNDPDRIGVINWIVQSRKDGWNLRLIGQSIDAIDKQIKETVIDELFSFRNSKNLFTGVFWRVFIAPWFNKIFPEFHACRQYDGRKKEKNRFIGVDWFQRRDLHSCYKTSQQFKKDVRIVSSENSKKPIEIDDRATYTVLHPRYFSKPVSDKIKANISQETKRDSIDNKEPVKPEEPGAQKAKEPYKPPSTVKSTLFFMVLFSSIYYFFFTDSDDKEQKTTPKSEPTFTKSKDEEFADLGKIFINCSVYSTDGNFTYCFNDEYGNIVEPEYAGFDVLYVSSCHAKIKREDKVQNVYCNPKRRPFDEEHQPLDLLALTK